MFDAADVFKMFDEVLRQGRATGAIKTRNGIEKRPCITAKQGHDGCLGFAYSPPTSDWNVCAGCLASRAR